MKSNYGLSTFLLAMVSVFVMAWPQNAGAQNTKIPLSVKVVRGGILARRAIKGYENVRNKVNAEINKNLHIQNHQSRILSINTGVIGVKTNALSNDFFLKVPIAKGRSNTTHAMFSPLLLSDIIRCEGVYAGAISALIDGNRKKFTSLIRRLSDAQYAPAMYAYAKSNLERCDRRERAKWLKLIRRSADAGYGHACAYISALYDYCSSEGNFEPNEDSAFVWAKRASDLGSYDGHLLAGQYALDKGDTLQSMKYLERAYKYGLRLKALYKKTDGMRSPDFYRAYFENTHSCASSLEPDLYDNLLSWELLNAKTKAHHKACYNLANFVSDKLSTSYSNFVLANYYMGLGDLIPANADSVVLYLGNASEKIPWAKAKLADCYYSGFGVKRDSVYATTLYREAAENGSAEAMYMLTFLYYEAGRYDSTRVWGTRSELADSVEAQYVVGCTYYKEDEYNKALDYFVRAADGGSVYGKWMAYVVYDTVLKDDDKAFYYLNKAAEAGYPDAMNDLAVCYLNADHVDRDVVKSIHLFEQAKDAGYIPAYNNLGCIYFAKKSVYGMKPDRKRAAIYWYEGAEKGDADSMYNYATCQIKGKYGVAKNKAEGYNLMRKAAEAGSEDAMEFLQKEGL